MAKQINIGVGGVVKKVKKVPASIGGVVKEMKKGVCGIDGVVKEFFRSEFTIYDNGYNPFNVHILPSWYNAATIESDHLEQTSGSYDKSGYSSIDMQGSALFYFDELVGLESLDDYSELVMEVDTKGKSCNYHRLGLNISFGARYQASYWISIPISNSTAVSGKRTVTASITDTMKTNFNKYHGYSATNGIVKCYIRSCYENDEGEDYDIYRFDPLSIYKVSLR